MSFLPQGRYQPIPPTPSDAEFTEGVRMFRETQLKTERLLGVREVTLKNLRSFKEDIEMSYDKSRKARIGGTVATVSGSIISIVGFALAPVTFGASLGLSITGGVIAAAGGMTITGAEIGYHVVSKVKLEDATKAYANDLEKMEGLKELGENFEKCVCSLAEKYNTTKERIYELLKEKSIALKVGRGVYYSYKLIDGFLDVGRAAKTTVTVARADRTVWAGLSTAGRALGVIGVV